MTLFGPIDVTGPLRHQRAFQAPSTNQEVSITVILNGMEYDSKYLGSDSPDVSFDEHRARCTLSSMPITMILWHLRCSRFIEAAYVTFSLIV